MFSRTRLKPPFLEIRYSDRHIRPPHKVVTLYSVSAQSQAKIIWMFENTKFYYFHPYFSVSTCYGDLHWNRSDIPKTCMRNYSCWFGNLPDYEKGRTQTILCFGSKISYRIGKTRTSSNDVDIVGSFPVFRTTIGRMIGGQKLG
jgi:hypothetical protein